MVKNPPANAGHAGSIPRSEDPPEEETAIHSSILAWEISWTEQPGGYNPWCHNTTEHRQEQWQEFVLDINLELEVRQDH